MANAQENSLINGRMKSYIIGMSVVATLLGWGFTLGIVYAQVQANTSEIEILRQANYGERLAGIESTLREIRDMLSRNPQRFAPQRGTP